MVIQKQKSGKLSILLKQTEHLTRGIVSIIALEYVSGFNQSLRAS